MELLLSLDLAALRTAVISNLSGIGINTYEHLSGAQSLPLAVLGNVEKIEYSKDFGGSASITIPLWVMVPRGDDASAQKALDNYVSIGTPSSIYSALKAATSATWRSLTVLSTGPYGSADVNTAPALAVAFNLVITA